MAGRYPEFQTRIAGRLVIVVTGTKSQTVNICTAEGKPSVYEATYRLPFAQAFGEADLPPVEDLDDLRDVILGRDGLLEDSNVKTTPRQLIGIAAPTEDDPWVTEAVIAVEQSITTLVNEFAEHPYMHRVEHSLHTRLYQLLKAHSVLNGDAAIGSTGRRTQLVHKEWPETVASPDSRRGAFDIAILAPKQLERASLQQFTQGRIAAPIVIEIGLDYGSEHLKQDYDKLLDSNVVAPYLIHFSRLKVTDEVETMKRVCTPETRIRTAYVHHSTSGECSVKQLTEREIAPWSGRASSPSV